jgi:hypothetical protein
VASAQRLKEGGASFLSYAHSIVNDESLIEEIEIIFVVIVSVFLVLVLYRFIKKLRLGRGHPKKMIITSGRAVLSDEPKTSQVIGMMKCEYCGALMPQTATSCPKCGAPKKT